MVASRAGFGTKAAAGRDVFKNIPVVTGRLALPQSEDVSEANQNRHERHEAGHEKRRTHDDEQHEEQGDARADAADQPPEQAAFQSPSAPFGIGCGIRIGQSKFGFHIRWMIGCKPRRLEVADADRAVAVQPEDFVEGIHRRRSRRDDGPADDGHFALVHVPAPDGKAAVDDGGDAEHKSEHHNHSQTVADAGFEIGGVERRALREGGQDIEREQGRDGKRGAQARPDFFRNE